MFLRYYTFFLLAFLFVPSLADARPQRPAKQLFGYVLEAAKMKPRSIGFYTKGCMAGGVQLPKTGPAWQAMRLSRNRNWGLPVLVDFVEKLALEAKEQDGWPGLLVGDMAQPRGGPMLSGHRSHQIGLDADIWLTPMPTNVQSYKRRETRAAISMLAKGGLSVDPKKWSDARARLIRRAASSSLVGRIFVHPAIKKALCEFADREKGSRRWLSRVRPWWGHHYHFHVRLNCPRGMRGCKTQPAPPSGDGCGKPLKYWFAKMRPKKIKKIKKPVKPRKKIKRRKRQPLTLASLPVACSTVLASGDPKRLGRLRYGVVGDIAAPVRNPKRGTGPNLAYKQAKEEAVAAAKTASNPISTLLGKLKGITLTKQPKKPAAKLTPAADYAK
ncbi:MAG: penicillin-insensitive murein endopeptidase [Hyphomicrobiaceae bacterium]|nr:penicillin-insensitive murein endopeptidase [Hyphomicrobiaceae bacterium]